jgi:hypothetical protein
MVDELSIFGHSSSIVIVSGMVDELSVHEKLHDFVKWCKKENLVVSPYPTLYIFEIDNIGIKVCLFYSLLVHNFYFQVCKCKIFWLL